MKTNDLCHYCMSASCFKEIFNEYYHSGSKEVYSDVISATFNITTINGNYKRLICERCITSLRAAAEFKKQVLAAEDRLKLLTLANDEEMGIQEPKLEFEEFEDATPYPDALDDFDDKVVWKDEEHPLEEKGHIFVIKLEPKKEVLEPPERAEVKVPTRKGRSNKRVVAKNKTKTKKRKKDSMKKETISQLQIDMRENSYKLVHNSNMCLFKSLKTRFACFHCGEAYFKITELREHTKIHSNPKQLALRFKSLRGLSYRTVDVSNLTCRLCSEMCTDIKELQTHLAIHDIKFADTGHFLIPYKLEENFKCVICHLEFETFTRLSIHMNCHYTNNVCEICGVSFINRVSLRLHVSSIHREKKCSLCPAVFTTSYNKSRHMVKVHNTGVSKRYCLLCNKTFRYTYQLAKHKIEEHGAKKQVSTCSECGKSFFNSNNLKVHIRSVHIRERNYQCSVCGLGFFTTCDQRRHERTHQDVRSFSCSFCDGRLKSKDSLRRHLKRQHTNLS